MACASGSEVTGAIRQFGGTMRRRGIAGLGTIVVLAGALCVSVVGDLHYAALPSTSMPDVEPLIAKLVARGDQVVYADYWIAWRLAFESRERLAAVPLIGIKIDVNPRGERYAPYLQRAHAARRWAYILPDHFVGTFTALLRRYHVPFSRWRWGTAALFYNHWDWGRPTIIDGPALADFPFGRVGRSR
jgi:hypothetical protein